MWKRPVLFPSAYTWYVLLASMDVMLTWVVLWLGGSELNTLAAWILDRHDVQGLVVLKFATVLMVLVMCEFIGQRALGAGKRLAACAVGINCVPVLAAGGQLAVLAVVV